MAVEENGGGLVGSLPSSPSSSQRQRFYVELIPGETTIVSWKKLIRKAREKDQSHPVAATVMGSLSGAHSSSSAHETAKKVLDGSSEVVQCSDSFVTSERLEKKNRATSSGHKQQMKRRVETTKVKDVENDGSSSTKRRRKENMSKKPTAAPSGLVKDHQLDGLQAFAADAPVLMNTTKSVGNNSKCGFSSPLNAVTNASVFPLKSKLNKLQKTGKISSDKSTMKVGISGSFSDAMHQNFAGKSVPLQTKPRFRKLLDEKKIEVPPKSQHNDMSVLGRERVDVVSPCYKSSSQHLKRASSAVNDATPVRTFSTSLEKAIRELEETVAESKSFKVEASDAHTSWLTIERELPLEVKLKLGKVASIMQSSQETISEVLVTCLVSIIGKLVRGKISKRILRKVIMVKLSARMEKAEKFKEIKDELLAMVANRPPNQQAADNPETKEAGILVETFKLNSSMEDKLCDFYDLCSQGLDGDKGVQVQKLFFELSELWPKGVMDHHKLIDAIWRAKSRRVLADKNKGQKAVQSGPRVLEDDVNRNADSVPGLKRKVTFSGASHKLMSSPPLKKAARKTNSVQQNSSMQRNLMNATTIPHVKEQKQEVVPEKTNVKIRFCLKQQKSEDDDKLNCLTTAAHLTCKRQS